MDSSSSPNNSQNKPKHHQPTSSELLASAKYVAEAAKAQASHDPNQKLDKDKLAAAAGHLVEAAAHYGKLEDNQFVEKAENYLHRYHSSSHSSTGSGGSPPPTTKHNTTSSHSSGQQGGESESGFGDYLKMAQGFMKK